MLQRYVPFLQLELPIHLLTSLPTITGRTKDSIYEPILADSEREAVADLLQYLENVRLPESPHLSLSPRIQADLTKCCYSVLKPISSPGNPFEPSAPSFIRKM